MAARRFAGERPWHVSMAGMAAGLAMAPAPTAVALLAASAAAAALALLGRPALAATTACVLLAGLLVGEARLAAVDAPGSAFHDGASVEGVAHLLGRPRRTAFGSSAEVRLLEGRHRGARLLARGQPWTRWPSGAAPGFELRVAGSFRRPRRSRAGFDLAAYLRRRGVAGELQLRSVRATGRRRGGAAGAVDRLRHAAEHGLALGLPGGDAGLARGMVLGQDEAIADRVRDDFRASGLGHLLAVSGQNVMLLAALALPLLALAGLSPRVRLLALLALIAVYVPLAGAGPSLQRAGVMGAAGVVALAASRPASRTYALVLAAVVTLALNPRASGDPGWQLSFAAVAGILCLTGPLRRAHGPPGDGPAGAARRVLVDGLAITVAATLATAPLAAYHFGSVPLAGLPANVAALPAVAPVMWLGMVKAGLGVLVVLGGPVGEAAGGLSEGLGPLTRMPLAYLSWVAEHFAALPGAQLHLPLRSAAGVAAAYAVMGGCALGALRVGRRLEPHAASGAGWWRRSPRRTRVALVAAGVSLLGLAAASGLAPPAPPGSLTVSFLDVGQGDATLVQHPDGTAVLFDGGPPEARVDRLLRRAGVRRLAMVVATHASRDHQGGLPEVIERNPVGLLLDGGDGTRDPGFRRMLEAASERGVRRVKAIAPLVLEAGALRISVLSPPPRPAGPPPEDPNPRAVVAVVESGGLRLLLSADAESEALAPLALGDVDLMKVPHHGSADPGLPDVLERVRPEIAAIEVGRNLYGHPTQSTLSALRHAGVRTYRTDRDGTVRVSLENGGMRVRTER